MADNKKHHYIPRFYLKYFSIQNNEVSINLYDKENSKYISNAALKTQAYKNYFYGKEDDLEKKLSMIEGQFAQAIKKIGLEKVLPNKNSEEYNILLLFTFIQGARTVEKVNEIYDMVSTIKKNLYTEDEKFNEFLNEMEIMKEEPAKENILRILSNIHAVEDLEMKLLINETQIPFITSDHPVIRYNQFMEQRKYQHGSLGLLTKGLQVFFPLTPKLLLIFFDKDVYKIGNRNERVILTFNNSDITQLNKLQIINSTQLIFFNEHVKEVMIKESHGEVIRYIIRQKSAFNEVGRNLNDDGTISSLMHFTNNDARINLQLSFAKQTKQAKRHKFSDYAAQVRNENLRFSYDSNEHDFHWPFSTENK